MPSGGDVVVGSPTKKARGGLEQLQQATSLPLDVVLEIAARTDPATLVRCAATCRDMRRRVVDDPTFGGRLRLQRTDRFVLPLLRGHLTGPSRYYDTREDRDDLFLLATTAAEEAKMTKLTWTFASGPGGKPLGMRRLRPLDSRDGLLLARTAQGRLLVCNPATRQIQTLPTDEPSLNDGCHYDPYHQGPGCCVLLVGDGEGGAVGRPFQVLKAKLVLSEYSRDQRCLYVQTFSSERGAWGPRARIPTPDVDGRMSSPLEDGSRPLVVGDVVHWLCLTRDWSYILVLHVGAARPRVTVSPLPRSFPPTRKRSQYLLVASSAGGGPSVLVADDHKISAWVLSPTLTEIKMWSRKPQVVIDNEAVVRCISDSMAGVLLERRPPRMLVGFEFQLVYFAERSGAVLIRTRQSIFLWLDLQRKQIVRWWSDPRASWIFDIYCPYELCLSSWVPTFNSAITL